MLEANHYARWQIKTTASKLTPSFSRKKGWTIFLFLPLFHFNFYPSIFILQSRALCDHLLVFNQFFWQPRTVDIKDADSQMRCTRTQTDCTAYYCERCPTVSKAFCDSASRRLLACFCTLWASYLSVEFDVDSSCVTLQPCRPTTREVMAKRLGP